LNPHLEQPRARALRFVTALCAAGLVAWALADDPFFGGDPGFGWAQALVLAAGLALGASSLLPLAWNARVLALAVSGAFALAVGEAAVRMLVGPRFVPAFEADERLLYRLVPGATAESVHTPANGGQRIRLHINRAGFRGDELAPRGDALRVVVYGDSFIQGAFSELPHTFAKRLEQHLADGLAAPVEVVNAGVAGYGPDQVLRKMAHELPILRPDLVIVAVYAGNDFGDLLRNKLYRLDEEGRLQEHAFTLDPLIAHRMRASRRESVLKRMVREVTRRLRTVEPWADGPEARRARMQAALEQNLREYEEYVTNGDPVVRELMSDPYNADVSLLPDGASARYRIALMERIVEAIQEQARAHQLPLLLLLIPHPVDVAGSHDTLAVDPERYPDYEPRAATSALERSARRLGLPFVNLFDPFEAHGAAALYFRSNDDHWNDRGQDVAAAIVAETLIESELLRARQADDRPDSLERVQ
jgi:lysophospholipase L1-like esterase